jgi:Spondin_N
MRLNILTAITLMVPLAALGCGSSNNSGGSGGSGGSGMAGEGGMAGTGGMMETGGTGGMMETGGTGGMAGAGGMEGGMAGAGGAGAGTKFMVTIQDVSANAELPSPVSPGVWALDASPNPLFTAGQPDRGKGLEHLAEDGDPTSLAESLTSDSSIAASGVFNTPVGDSQPGPATPGKSYQFTVTATPADGNLTFASMFGQTDDVFIGPDGDGIPLFDQEGKPLPERDVTAMVAEWDAGTERNEAPGMGPDQAPRQAAPDTGPAEGVVAHFSDSTRSLPIASKIVDVKVTEANGAFTFEVDNVSASSGAITTPVAPVFYATHDGSWTLFTDGGTASKALESLAEDGSPAMLVSSETGALGIVALGAATTPKGASAAGPAMPGQAYTFTVQANAPALSFACMVVESNDAYIALPPGGVALLDSSGQPRSAADVQADVMRMLTVWDAGTEANEVPGVGPNQPPRQAAPDTGPADPNPKIRRYSDDTNDLAGPSLGGFASVTVHHMTGDQFQVTVSDTSGNTAYPGVLTPVLWAVHDDSTTLFDAGKPAPNGLEPLAEDGNAMPFATAVSGMSGVGSSGVDATAIGASAAGPIMSGHSYQFTVTADATHRFLSLASMVVPSNDTFMALDPGGVALLDSSGNPRSDSDIAADIQAHLFAWDAGTEANQAGAAGPDQAPRQAAANTGASEGNGTVRKASTDPVWGYTPIADLVKVTIRPM